MSSSHQCMRVRKMITKCVPIIYCILQYRQLTLEKAPRLEGPQHFVIYGYAIVSKGKTTRTQCIICLAILFAVVKII